jgi:hypothetical protein
MDCRLGTSYGPPMVNLPKRWSINMRKFLGTLLIVALIVAGVGVYRGWFGVSTDDQPGETNVELKIDKQKIKQDAAAASTKARELTGDGND